MLALHSSLIPIDEGLSGKLNELGIRGKKMALLALFPLLMIGTVLVVALSIHDEGHAWDGSATFASAK